MKIHSKRLLGFALALLVTGSCSESARAQPQSGKVASSTKSSRYPSGSVFTVHPRLATGSTGGNDPATLGWMDGPSYNFDFNQAVIEFKDNGSIVDEGQLQAATRCIRAARESVANGAVVVVFIHGWHHSAEWKPASGDGDSHFQGFREMLRSLAVREGERTGGRRVIGIYLGWSGDPPDLNLLGIPLPRDSSFYERMRVVEQIGRGASIVKTVQEIVLATKQPLTGALQGRPESPLIMIGHSMGALMLESAFLSLLTATNQPLVFDRNGPRSVVDVQVGGKPVYFPDLFLAFNSAADSVIAKKIIAELKQRNFTKTIDSGRFRYAAPVLVSMTSTADQATGIAWRLAHLLDPTHRTDGNDPSIFTHGLKFDPQPVRSQMKNAPDFGQDWHSLRAPNPARATTPVFAIDLPEQSRATLKGKQPVHQRYELGPLAKINAPQLAWVLQVPPNISKDHNDIFNFRARLFMMSLMQISGAVMSLAVDFNDNFE